MKTLLLADDDRDLEPLVRMMLKGRGFDVEAVHDGARALAMIEKRRFSVVLLDLMMPEMNGIEVIQRLTTEFPEVAKRVIVLTASDPRLLATLDRTSIAGVVLKPFDVDAMTALVDAVANGSDGSH